MIRFEQTLAEVAREPRTWAVTGVAGFIGSNILRQLLLSGQRVVGLDNFVTGYHHNLDEVAKEVGAKLWARFRLVTGDIRDPQACREVTDGADYVLHQAALGSVPLSLERPDETHAVNVTGFINMLQAARAAGVRRLVYASSCAVYGDDPESPKLEERLGPSISPYATSKHMNELYADVFARCYDIATVGLRYFNVYGRRQDPQGAYAAVIPRWIDAILQQQEVRIFGDGRNSRDFVYVQDVVQANILAASLPGSVRGALVCNVGTGAETSLNELFAAIRDLAHHRDPGLGGAEPVYEPPRPGDIRHSRADIGRARTLLGYAPTHSLSAGLGEAFDWYAAQRRGAGQTVPA